MKRKLFYLIVALFAWFSKADAQSPDACASATSLCAGSTKTGSTTSATTVGSDPAMSCGDGVLTNTVWYSILAIGNGNFAAVGRSHQHDRRIRRASLSFRAGVEPDPGDVQPESADRCGGAGCARSRRDGSEEPSAGN